MVAILLVAHAPLASALVATGRHPFPGVPLQLEAVDVPAEAAPEDVEVQVRTVLARWAQADPAPEVLVLADVCGATPANAALRAIEGSAARCVVGVGLPMLWRALHYRAEPLDQVVAKALEGGVKGVMTLVPGEPPNCPAMPGG